MSACCEMLLRKLSFLFFADRQRSLQGRSDGRAVVLHGRALGENVPLFEFPLFVCPEPVLANVRFLGSSGAKEMRFLTCGQSGPKAWTNSRLHASSFLNSAGAACGKKRLFPRSTFLASIQGLARQRSCSIY